MNLREINLRVKLRKLSAEASNTDSFSRYRVRGIVIYKVDAPYIFTDNRIVDLEVDYKLQFNNGRYLRYTNWLTLHDYCILYFVEDSKSKTS